MWALVNVAIRGRPVSAPSLQFDLNIGCGTQPAATDALLLYYSLNLGASWTLCARCNPLLSSSCRTWDAHCDLRSLPPLLGKWTRITLRQPNSAQVRFRFVHAARDGLPVAIAALGIDIRCKDGCRGHGRCSATGTCLCDSGYVLDAAGACIPALGSLPRVLRVSFDNGTVPADRIARASGTVYAANGACGVLGSGAKFVAHMSGQRVLETRDIDTSNARILEYFLAMGDGTSSCSGPVSSTYGVALGYSTDGGLSYTWLANTYYRQAAGQQSVALPSSAQAPATRFMWLQTTSRRENYDVWAVDEIYIGPPSAAAPTSLEEHFEAGIGNDEGALWVKWENGVGVSQCKKMPKKKVLLGTN